MEGQPEGPAGLLDPAAPTTVTIPGDSRQRMFHVPGLVLAAAVAAMYLFLEISFALPGAAAAAGGHAVADVHASNRQAFAAAFAWTMMGAMCLAALAAAEPWSAISAPLRPASRLLPTAAVVFCLAELPTVVLSAVQHWTLDRLPGAGSYLGGAAQTPVLGSVTESIAAGFSEEVVVLAGPVLLLRAVWRRPLGPVGRGCLITVLAALRLSYHVEYGLGVLPLLPWAIACALIYERSRALIPLMIAHAVYDVVVTMANRVDSYTQETLILAVACAVVAVYALLSLRQARTADSLLLPRG
ncbi:MULTISPECIES: CPBP family intramembrane glutamic endopeptidase [Streptacidiphilus]|uniref:CPBP family intramembrane glutamic endopeptidase n=1 Tax=Streptacidiphilus cavernicola TaxID=3342716 RepID=A0ABV6UWN4_9ACTN|nr:CPBP family intramembrane glutamic endopeptidase [Streptacidiphilus jeojiense]